ncbi:MAG: DUF998 domain-containing protein [Pseudomonadota bacterium]|nr:DUF998 domain-containing protein [Pseudomonadota bacterium]
MAGFGWRLEGYAQALHPVGLLGAQGVPGALAFNVLAFVIPGAIAAALAWRLRDLATSSPRLSAGLGWQLVFLSALAFAAQGLLPLDPTDLDAPPSRLHALAWTLWWLAFVPGALLLAWTAWQGQPRRYAGFAVHAAAAGWLLALTGPLAAKLDAALAQRLAYGVWFVWLAWAGWARARAAGVSRGAASGPGSSPPVRR